MGLVRRLSEDLRLVRKVNDEPASAKASAAKSGLRIAQLDNVVLSGADEHDILMHTEATAAHRRDGKQNGTFKSRMLYLHAVLLLQKIETTQSTGCKKRSSSFDDFPLNKTPRTKTCSLLVKKVYPNTMSIFSFDPADKSKASPARAKTRAQNAARAAEKHFKLGEGLVL